MKTLQPTRVLATAAVTALFSTAVVQGAPKKPAPAPSESVEKAPEVKKGFLSKVKDVLPFKKKQDSAPQPSTTQSSKKAPPAPAPVKASPEKKTTATAARTITPANKVAPPAEQKEPGFFKSLFTKKPEPKEAATTGSLAKAKAAKPAPVKEKERKPQVAEAPAKQGFFKSLFTRNSESKQPGDALASTKKAKPAASKTEEKKEELAAATEDKPKRGFLGFFKKQFGGPLEEANVPSEIPDALKIERPKDWSEYSVIRADEVALYEYGPAQLGGADARLATGTLVKVTKNEKGWAKVEVQGENKRTGYIDAYALRAAEKGDFHDPPPAVQMASNPSFTLDPWAPLAPPPDLPEQPGNTNAAEALLLLPPLELEPKP